MEATEEKKYFLLKEISRCGNQNDFQTDITPVRNIMNKFLPDLMFENPDAYTRLKAEYIRLKEYAAYRELAKKNIVTLCGKTSGGKSSFFNSLYNGGIFPVDNSTFSSVPVYAVCGHSNYIYGINNFDHFVRLERDEMKTIFSGIETEDPDIFIPLGHMFSSLLTYASTPDLKHIAFLDMPGYTQPEETSFSSEKNMAGLINRINCSNYILWFADINIINLGISDSDINFLKKLDPAIPKLIIISKADIFSQNDFPEILEKNKKILNARGVTFIDVLAYSKQQPEKFDKYKILAYLDRWDKSPSIINFSQKFETIFDSLPSTVAAAEFKNSLMPEIHKVSSSIYNIQNAFEQKQKTDSDNFIPVENIQRPSNPLKNIDLSKIKITDLPIPNPEKLFRNYNDRNQLDTSGYERYINSVSITLMETMKDIKPAFSVDAKNNEYKNEVSKTIAGLFNVSMIPDESSDNPPGEEINQTAEERTSRRRSRNSRSKREDAEIQSPDTSAETPAPTENRPVRRERSGSGVSRRRLR